jgi:HK97 family phage prohead protease
MRHKEHLVRSFEVKATEDGSGFEGLGAVFHNLDRTGDIIVPGAFADELSKFVESGFIGGLNHDWDNPIGHPIEARETPQGLYIKAVFDDSDDARNVRAKMLPNPHSGRATVRQLSIGYNEKDAERLTDPEAVKAYWVAKGYSPTPGDLAALESRKSVRLLKKVHLYEVSPVSRPANELAAIFAAKSEAVPARDFSAHSQEVVSAVGSFVSRAGGRVNARLKDGRELSGSNRTALQRLHSGLLEHCSTLKDLLDRTAPKAKTEPDTPEAAKEKEHEAGESRHGQADAATATPDQLQARNPDLAESGSSDIDRADITKRYLDMKNHVRTAIYGS